MNKLIKLLIISFLILVLNYNLLSQVNAMRIDLASYSFSNISNDLKIVDTETIFCTNWLGFGFSLYDRNRVLGDYLFLKEQGKKYNYRITSFFSPSFSFIPLAKTVHTTWFDSTSIDFFRFRITYCPWSSLKIYDFPDLEKNRQRVNILNIDFSYTFIIKYFSGFPITLQTGYSRFNKPAKKLKVKDAESITFPSHKYEGFYIGIGIALGGTSIEAVDFNEKFSFSPLFIPEKHDYALEKRDYAIACQQNSIESFEKFLSKYPKNNFEVEVNEKINDLKLKAELARIENEKAENEKVERLKAELARIENEKAENEKVERLKATVAKDEIAKNELIVDIQDTSFTNIIYSSLSPFPSPEDINKGLFAILKKGDGEVHLYQIDDEVSKNPWGFGSSWNGKFSYKITPGQHTIKVECIQISFALTIADGIRGSVGDNKSYVSRDLRSIAPKFITFNAKAGHTYRPKYKHKGMTWMVYIEEIAPDSNKKTTLPNHVEGSLYIHEHVQRRY